MSLDTEAEHEPQASVAPVNVPGYLTLAEVAQRSGLKPSTLYVYLHYGRLPPPMRVGRGLLWPEAEITSWIASRRSRRVS